MYDVYCAPHCATVFFVRWTIAAQSDYSTLGFVPEEQANNAVSLTLEFAYDDGVLARVASFLNDSATAVFYTNRSKAYRQVFALGVQKLRV